MEIEHQFILSIYQYGSLTRAAKQLGISQPALTMRLNSLEEKLGFPVFDRKQSPVEATEAGKIFIEYLHRNAALLAEYQGRIDSVLQAENCHFTVGGPAVYLETVIASAIRKLRAEEPSLSVDLRVASLSELIDQTLEGKIDFFISTSNELPAGFRAAEIGKEELCLCVPGAWPVNADLAKCRMTPYSDGVCFDYHILDGLPFIGMEKDQPIQKKLDRFFEAFNITPKWMTTVNQASCCIRFAAMGEGICIASREAVLPFLSRNELAVYPLPASFSERSIYLSYNEDHHLTRTCRSFIRILEQQYLERS